MNMTKIYELTGAIPVLQCSLRIRILNNLFKSKYAATEEVGKSDENGENLKENLDNPVGSAGKDIEVQQTAND